ncbi:MAG: formylglycine-generating enzyme family protein [Myxococcales bacterium]|nr:formylglycine-generating enzyme family protein [Myxococcales bacterium]
MSRPALFAALAALAVSLAACLEVPPPLAPLDPGAPDRGGDAAPVDGSPDPGADHGPPDAAPTAERCDGRDDDGDGVVDEAASDPPAAACAVRIPRCLDGAWRLVADGYEPDEVSCDGRDNDCDGLVDEGFAAACTWCDGQPGPPCNGCPPRVVVPAGFVCAPSGRFVMGSPAGQPNAEPDEQPAHAVEISGPLLVGAAEVTRGDFEAALGVRDRSHFGRLRAGCVEDGCPVEQMSLYDALAYADARSLRDGLPPCHAFIADDCLADAFEGCPADALECAATDDASCPLDGLVAGLDAMLSAGCAGWRLPTEAEWEYAARAGTETRYWIGDTPDELATVAWFAFNAGGVTHPVAALPANPWGLHGVHGNVAEWTLDGFAPYPVEAQSDPWVAPAGEVVVRGGSWDAGSAACRSAAREGAAPGWRSARVGLRLVRRVSPLPPP